MTVVLAGVDSPFLSDFPKPSFETAKEKPKKVLVAKKSVAKPKAKPKVEKDEEIESSSREASSSPFFPDPFFHFYYISVETLGQFLQALWG